MGIDIRQKVHDFQKKNLPRRKKRSQSGYSVSLQEGEHRVARYTKEKDRVSLQEAMSVGTEELQKISRAAKSLAVCFSPRSIYADLGDFSNVSEEATRAHIRSTIDKTGLFNEQYDLSFKKIYDIDGVRAKYSYLAIPESEIGKISLLNEHEAFIDTYCPIEASIAAMVGQESGEMSIALFEDEQYMRILGTKTGTIYHIITFDKQNSFDLTAETIAGINEMTSLMRNTYNEPPKISIR